MWNRLSDEARIGLAGTLAVVFLVVVFFTSSQSATEPTLASMNDAYGAASRIGRVIGGPVGNGRFVAFPVCNTGGFVNTVLVDRGSSSPIKTDFAITMGAAVVCDSRLEDLNHEVFMARDKAAGLRGDLSRANRQLGATQTSLTRERRVTNHLTHDLSRVEAGCKSRRR